MAFFKYGGCTMASLLLLLLCISTLLQQVDGSGGAWNSHQLAVGEWRVTLHGGWFFDPLKIFPPQPSPSVVSTISSKSSSSTRMNGNGDKTLLPSSSPLFAKAPKLSPRRRPWGSHLDCTLSMCQDGTFVLRPTLNNNNNSNNQSVYLPIRGIWKVTSNPYCVTDRFYDQLILKSYPRKEIVSTMSSNPFFQRQQQQQQVPLRSIQLSLSGRMWGRYSSTKKPKQMNNGNGRNRCINGKITHGALICRESNKASNKHYKKRQWFPTVRPIWASFSAYRESWEPKEDGWDDEQFFGY